MRSSFLFWITIVTLFVLFTTTSSMLVALNSTNISGVFGFYSVHEMMVKQDAWSGTNDSRIEGEIFVTIQDTPSSGRVHLFLFPDTLDYLVQLYYDYLHNRDTCPDFRDPEVLKLFSANANTNLLMAYDSIYYPGGQPKGVATRIGHFIFNKTIPFSSKYSLFITHCATNTGGQILLDGSISFVNPFGHLDADLYPIMIANAAVLLPIMVLVFAIYGALMLWHRTSLHMTQYILPALIFIGILGTAMKISYYRSQNHSGVAPPRILTLLMSSAGALFIAASRLVLFIIAQGIGIVYYRTSNAKISLMAIFCIFYCVLLMLQSMFEARKDPFQNIGPFVLSVLIPAFNSAYFIWISHSLTQSLSLAQTTRSKFKIQLFERLSMLFQVCSLLLFVYAVIQLIKMDISNTSLWTIWWLFDIYSYLVYIGGIAAAMFIFLPRQSNHLLNYTEDLQAPYNSPQNEGDQIPAPATTQVTSIEAELPHRKGASILTRSPLVDVPPILTNHTSDPPRRRMNRPERRELDLQAAAQRTLLLSSGEEFDRP